MSLLKNWLIIPFIIISIYAATVATISFVNVPKIGYVDSSILLERYQGAIEAREKIKKQSNEWQDNIKTLESELSQLNQEIVEKGNNWDQDTRKKKQDVFFKRQSELGRYNRAIGEKAIKLEQELMGPVYSTLNSYMKDFGKLYSYSMIFGTVAGGNILFAKESNDLTNEFLAFVNSREQSNK